MPPIEYERRWLVVDAGVTEGHMPTVIAQGYLFTKDGWTVRIRRSTRFGHDRRSSTSRNTIAVKGPRVAAQRIEYEWDVDQATAAALYRIAPDHIVKSRYAIVDGGYTWDVDVFHWDNEGLVIAELESTTTIRDVATPVWCGQEVTSLRRYNNEELAKRPWTTFDAA
jgi:adenylate cyclase